MSNKPHFYYHCSADKFNTLCGINIEAWTKTKGWRRTLEYNSPAVWYNFPLKTYGSRKCPECLKHPDLHMLILGDLP